MVRQRHSRLPHPLRRPNQLRYPRPTIENRIFTVIMQLHYFPDHATSLPYPVFFPIFFLEIFFWKIFREFIPYGEAGGAGTKIACDGAYLPSP